MESQTPESPIPPNVDPSVETKPQQDSKKGLGIILFSSTLAILLLFSAVGLIVSGYFQRQRQAEEESEVIEEVTRNDTSETEDGMTEEVSTEEATEDEVAGVLMVYTEGNELRLLYDDGASVLLDTLESPYTGDEDPVAYPSYPSFSPDGTKVLYSSGLSLKVYDLEADSSEVIYTGHEEGVDGTTTYSAITRYGWKDDFSILFVSDEATSSGTDLVETNTVKELTLSDSSSSDWGTYEMQTGFGGASDDPADWLAWHFSDLLGLSHRLYYANGNAYVHTYIDQGVWVRIPLGGTHEVVPDLVVENLIGVADYSTSLTQSGTYESDASIQDYVLEAMMSAPANFTYFDAQILMDGTSIYSADKHFVGNLQPGTDGDYLYFSEVNNSTALANALDSEVPAGTIMNYYPNTFIRRIDLTASEYDVELVVEGLDFDLY